MNKMFMIRLLKSSKYNKQKQKLVSLHFRNVFQLRNYFYVQY